MVIANSLNSIDELPQKVEHLAGRMWAIEALLLSICEVLPRDTLSIAHGLFEREIASVRDRIRPMSDYSIAVQAFESKVRQISTMMA